MHSYWVTLLPRLTTDKDGISRELRHWDHRDRTPRLVAPLETHSPVKTPNPTASTHALKLPYVTQLTILIYQAVIP